MFSLLSFFIVLSGLFETCKVLSHSNSSESSSNIYTLIQFWILFGLFHTLLPVADELLGFWFPFYLPLRLILLFALAKPGNASNLALKQLIQPGLNSAAQHFHAFLDSLNTQITSLLLFVLLKFHLLVCNLIDFTCGWTERNLSEMEKLGENLQTLSKQKKIQQIAESKIMGENRSIQVGSDRKLYRTMPEQK